MRRDSVRIRGSILILVAGMAALLLSMTVAVLVAARSLAGPSIIVLAEAQNRITLGSALLYIQETSRMGWGSGPGDMSYGWTDVRDGSAGPCGQTDANGVPQPQYTGSAYPAEGGVFRGDLYAWQLPPCAISTNPSPNPLRLADADLTQAAWSAEVSKPAPADFTAFDARIQTGFDPYWLRASQRTQTDGVGPYVGQPVKDTWAAFISRSNLAPRPESIGLTWFRIYREKDSDRNGDGTPWYDTVPFAGHGTFVVTVGAGGTRGYRFWNGATDYLNGRTGLPASSTAQSAAIEPVTAEASGQFVDERTFRVARANERIAWYRVQWTANSSAGVDSLVNTFLGRGGGGVNYLNAMIARQGQMRDLNITPHYGGAIRWIQRLEQEPPTW